MKFVLILTLLISTELFADPHYFQTLHPFGDEAVNNKYLARFSDPLTTVVDKYQSASGTDDVYLYIYVFNEQNLHDFELSVKCDSNLIDNKAMVMEISRPYIFNNQNITWSLSIDDKKQFVWLYSAYAPTERSYKIKNNNGDIIRDGVIKAPSCVK